MKEEGITNLHRWHGVPCSTCCTRSMAFCRGYLWVMVRYDTNKYNGANNMARINNMAQIIWHA